MRNDSTCKGCEERHQGCHITCERYKAFREDLDKQKEERMKALKVSDVIDDYNIRRIERTRKAMQKKRAPKRNGRK